jgi:hypothetical protein
MAPRDAKRPDPYDGWMSFTTVRSGNGTGQCQYSCRCGTRQMCATRGIAAELARAHVAQHGVVIPVAAPVPARNARLLAEVEAERQGPAAVTALRTRQHAAARRQPGALEQLGLARHQDSTTKGR